MLYRIEIKRGSANSPPPSPQSKPKAQPKRQPQPERQPGDASHNWSTSLDSDDLSDTPADDRSAAGDGDVVIYADGGCFDELGQPCA